MPLEPATTRASSPRTGGPPRWVVRSLWALVLLALLADFVANEKPLYCRLGGKAYVPVVRDYLVRLGAAEWPAAMPDTRWREREYEAVVFPPIPWSPGSIDRQHLEALGPFERQEGLSWRERHWLGTDTSGRDVAAGMVHGTRTALAVGLGSMLLAGLIGLLIGATAGYFGDHGLRVRRGRLLAFALGAMLFLFYLLYLSGPAGRMAGLSLGWALAGTAAGTLLLGWLLGKLPVLSRRVGFPADAIALRLIEITNGLPGLLVLLSLLTLLGRPGTGYLVLILGLLSWPTIARFARAEMLSVREREYIEAARAMGFGEGYILWRHALPNALGPVLVVMAFGVAGAILSEAYLSFLGIGMPVEQVTWGGLLSEARREASAWWLALFPGLAIFFSLFLFNTLGERRF